MKNRNPQETRRRILQAADALIRSRGLARVTTREIARAAGCADGALYKHFETKEDLFLAVVLESLPRFESVLDPAVTEQFSVAENLKQIASAAIEFFEQVLPHGVALLADSELLARHRKRLSKKNSGPQILYRAVAAYIEVEQARGRMNPAVTPVSAAALVLGPCFQWALTRMINGRSPLPVTDQQFSNQVIDSLLEGLAFRL